jgi:polyisoprenoid-binding protein YceI
MIVTGTVRQSDGRTPAAGVTVYAYQTNQRGAYARDRGAEGLASLHGRLRGWAITGAEGAYTLQTIRPGPYPGGTEPQHIHLEVLPPGAIACEIDPVEFTDDPLLTRAERAERPGYGGSGIVTPARGPDGSWRARRDIRLWDSARTDTMLLDTEASVVHWTGTKFGGRGSHAGDIRLAAGNIRLGGAAMVSGTITLPLASLTVTDIPAWEPIPRNRLRRHLLDPDFFDAARFPDATLVLERAVRVEPGRWRVEAQLTMHGVTRPIIFDAVIELPPEAGISASAFFRINRHHWGLSYRGSQLGNDLVDDDITFRVRLVARRRRS